MISPDFREFIESGVSVLIGTRSDRLVPESCRGVGVKVEPDGAEMVVYLPVATSEATVANLRDNGRIAVSVSRAVDHRSLQVKGQALSIEPAGEDDRRQILRYRGLLAEVWGFIGIPPRITLRIAWWPAWAVRLRVEAVYNQTPGPGAGASMTAGLPARSAPAAAGASPNPAPAGPAASDRRRAAKSRSRA